MLLRSILIALAACLAGSAAAASCGPYTVAMYQHGALYYRSGEQWAGIDKDIVDELARRTGCELRMTRDSRIRIWTMLKEGTLDMTMSGISTPEREGFARFKQTLNFEYSQWCVSAPIDPKFWRMLYTHSRKHGPPSLFRRTRYTPGARLPKWPIPSPGAALQPLRFSSSADPSRWPWSCRRASLPPGLAAKPSP